MPLPETEASCLALEEVDSDDGYEETEKAVASFLRDWSKHEPVSGWVFRSFIMNPKLVPAGVRSGLSYEAAVSGMGPERARAKMSELHHEEAVPHIDPFPEPKPTPQTRPCKQRARVLSLRIGRQFARCTSAFPGLFF